MGKSKIEWTDRVWNPVTGCTKISEGCQNCYAERMSKRFTGTWGLPEDDYFKVKLHPERLEEPYRWKKPSRIFVCSMSDLFHEKVSFEFIDRVFATMADNCRHTFIVLTKRPDRMKEYLYSDNQRYTARKVFNITKKEAGKFDCDLYWPLENVWLGVTAENQQRADERIPILLQIPAVVRFVSVEPMLGPVNLRLNDSALYHTSGYQPPISNYTTVGECLNWVICGGESGSGARPMHSDWVRSLRDQCQDAGVPFFFKQWGEWAPLSSAGVRIQKPSQVRAGRIIHGENDCFFRFGKSKSGRELDGQTWDQYPEV